MYKYLFGPVPSRRLGISLGVDLVPFKICSLNCVYCECGCTTNLTIERKEYVPYKDVVKELEHYFNHNPDPDYITFSGSGEPTLNSRIGNVLKFIKKQKPNIPVAVLTNGTLFYQEQLRSELLDANLILPSLDAALDLVFQKINMPFHGLNLEDYIQGLQDFRSEYKGKMWLEVFILPGYNDGIANLLQLKKALERIRPDSIQLNTLDRPGAIEGIHAADRADLQAISDFWNLENVEIIASAPERKEIKSYRDDMENAVLDTIQRRPCTPSDLAQILGSHINEVNKYLNVLEADGKVETVRGGRGVFYQTKRKQSLGN
jgi:wyosine [tRNA(Phe)-imidazoG37] synthetase (radical SAM superfamily)